jgi:hypothetical protein
MTSYKAENAFMRAMHLTKTIVSVAPDPGPALNEAGTRAGKYLNDEI